MLRRLTTLFLPLLLLNPCIAADDEIGEGEDAIQGMIHKTTPLRTHSLAPPYVDSDLQNRWWDFGADTIIVSRGSPVGHRTAQLILPNLQNTNKHVRLTQDKASQTGWLWSRMPLTIANWQIDVEFKVDGKAHSLFGDGFAMWIAKERATVGPVFGNVDYFTGLGIFFDTYANARHAYQWPRVTAMMGDGKTPYDHDHDNAANEFAACSEKFRRRNIPTKARLTYIKGKMLQLKLQTQNEDIWTTCFEVDQALPDSPYIGFTALTGDVSDAHDIVKVETYSAILKPEYREKQSPVAADSVSNARTSTYRGGKGRPTKQKSKSGAASWFLFILKLIGLAAFIAFSVAAYRTYNAQKKTRRNW